jgi:hypothetical protein
MAKICMADQRFGGEGGIRTPGTVPRTLDFESSAFNRARPPLRLGGHTIGSLFPFKILIVFFRTRKPVLKEVKHWINSLKCADDWQRIPPVPHVSLPRPSRTALFRHVDETACAHWVCASVLPNVFIT